MLARNIVTGLAKEAGIDLEHDVTIHDDRFYDAVISSGTLGLGESYMEGWWDAKDKSVDQLVELICQANLNTKIRSISLNMKLALLWKWLCIMFWVVLGKIFPSLAVKRSRKVGLDHYDLGNEVYEQMLDPTQQYSCAYFRNLNDRDDALEQAQISKMQLIRQKLQLKPGNRVLDIGCGWGTLAQYLATHSRNITVDGITISKEQLNGCPQSENTRFFFSDYRDWNPEYQYDAIVSVGMFEHVNSQYYRTFMETVHRLLKPGGLCLLHTVGGNISRPIGDPWLNTYIFPHSQLPSLAQISTASEGLLVIEDVHNFGPHYDRTLMTWHRNFINNFEKINEKREELCKFPLDSKFQRMWEYYLLMCAGSFRGRQCQLYQVVLSKGRSEIYTRPSY